MENVKWKMANGKGSIVGNISNVFYLTFPFLKSHRPTHRQAVIFFFFTIGLVATVIVWIFFINKGTISVSGPVPFIINVGGKNVECAQSPCSLQLVPRKYAVSLQKEGYYNDSQAAVVSRAEVAELNANFRFIPILSEVGEIVLPNEFVPLIDKFIGVKQLINFPRNAGGAIFDSSGNLALVTLGKEVYIYDVEAHSLNKTALRSSQIFDWAGNDVAVLEDGLNLSLVNDITGAETGELIVTFKRAFAEPKILGSPSGKKILIAENVDGASAYYLIDIEKKSRTKLAIDGETSSAKWVGDYIIFEDPAPLQIAAPLEKKVIAMHEDTLKTIDLPAMSDGNITSLATGKLIFVTSSKHDLEGNKIGISIREAVEEATRESQDNEIAQITKVYITEFDTETLLGQSLVVAPEGIQNLTADTANNRIYFTRGETLFEIVL